MPETNSTPAKRRPFAHRMHNAYTAWIVLLFGFIFTGAAWYTSDQFVQANARERFENRANEISSAIDARMLEYEQVLRGGVAFFNASGLVDRKNFHSYVTGLNVEENWPGIQGFGFSIPVAAADKSKHIDDIRGEGFPGYTIKPDGNREEYSAIIYLEPFDSRNKRAFGFDMWSNAMRRQAMTRARDTGEASTSGIITLVQETKDDVQKGFLTYLPLYKNDMALTTVEQRRAAFVGWVYAPFRMGNLMAGILGSGQSEIEYEIFDDDRLTKDTLLYDSNKSYRGENSVASGVITKTQKLEFQGRQWTLQFSSGMSALSASESHQPTIVALAGLTVDFLLFYIISSLALLQKRAEKLAREMTIEAHASEEKSSLILESAGDGICGLDKDGNATFVNSAGCAMLGYAAEELIGQSVRRVILYTNPYGTSSSPQDHPVFSDIADRNVRTGTDEMLRRKDGSSFPIEYTSTPIEKDGEVIGRIVMFRNIAERKEIDRLKSQFISTVSHELRTPLTSIKGSLGMVRSGALKDPAQIAEMVDLAASNTERLIRLVNDLLVMEKLQADRLEFEFAELDLSELIEHAMEINEPFAKEHNVTFNFKKAVDGALVYGDADRLT